MSIQSQIAYGLKPNRYKKFFQAYFKLSLAGKVTGKMNDYAESLERRKHRGIVMFNEFRQLGV